jgi:hypothetical protein
MAAGSSALGNVQLDMLKGKVAALYEHISDLLDKERTLRGSLKALTEKCSEAQAEIAKLCSEKSQLVLHNAELFAALKKADDVIITLQRNAIAAAAAAAEGPDGTHAPLHLVVTEAAENNNAPEHGRLIAS